MLNTLKSKAIEAENNVHIIGGLCFELKNDNCKSELIDKIEALDLNCSKKELLLTLASKAKGYDDLYMLLEKVAVQCAIEYAEMKVNGKVGDIIYFIDYFGRRRAIIIEKASMHGQDVLVFGKRYLKSGKIGQMVGFVDLEVNQWQLNRPFKNWKYRKEGR